MSEVLTAEQKLQKIQEQAKARQAKFYLAKKEALLAKKKEKYHLDKEANKSTVKAEEPIMSELKNLLNSDTDLIETTKIHYYNTIKSIIRLLNADNLIEVVNYIADKPTKFIKLIDTAIKPDGEAYSDNSKLNFYKVIPRLMRICGIVLSNKANELYKFKMEEYNYIYQLENQEGVNHQVLPTLTDYIKQVNAKHGEDSERALIVAIYSEITARDDFSHLHIVASKKDTKDKTKNYIIVNKTTATIIINEHKTASTSGALEQKLTASLAKRIRAYIVKNNIQVGEELFKQERLSPIISLINQSLGLTGGISTIRRIVVSDTHNNESSFAEKKELAKKMGHSLNTATIYKTKKQA